MMEELRTSLLVADSKLCNGPTLAQAFDLEFNLVTLVPDTWSVKKLIIAKASGEDLPFLMETEEKEVYHGKSYKIPYTLEIPGKPDRIVELRFLALHSSQLEKQRREATAREARKERQHLEKFIRRQRTTSYACLPDAEQAGDKLFSGISAKHHRLEFKVEKMRQEKKKRGPKKAGATPEVVIRYRLQCTIREVIKENPRFAPEGMFVLLTTIPDRRCLPDLSVLTTYKGQEVVERGFHWMKGPLRVTPVWLEKTTRIDVLGFVYLIAMFVYALIQREVRKVLAAQGATLPTPAGPRTNKPTAWGLFFLLDKLTVFRLHRGSSIQVLPKNFNKVQLEILNRCGWMELYIPRGDFP